MDGFGIMDTMRYIKPDVVTVCTWLAASFGAMLLMSGAKGKRYALPNAEIMIHQPLWWTQWQATDIQIAAAHIQRLKKTLNWYIADFSGQPIERIEKDVERDYWMTAKEALDYGLIDYILEPKA
jgi:ATP-dependent Clp protease protease subunit